MSFLSGKVIMRHTDLYMNTSSLKGGSKNGLCSTKLKSGKILINLKYGWIYFGAGYKTHTNEVLTSGT